MPQLSKYKPCPSRIYTVYFKHVLDSFLCHYYAATAIEESCALLVRNKQVYTQHSAHDWYRTFTSIVRRVVNY